MDEWMDGETEEEMDGEMDISPFPLPSLVLFPTTSIEPSLHVCTYVYMCGLLHTCAKWKWKWQWK